MMSHTFGRPGHSKAKQQKCDGACSVISVANFISISVSVNVSLSAVNFVKPTNAPSRLTTHLFEPFLSRPSAVPVSDMCHYRTL